MPLQPFKNIADAQLTVAIDRAIQAEGRARREWRTTLAWLQDLEGEQLKRTKQ